MKFEVGKCPTEQDSLTNCLYVHPDDARLFDASFDDTYTRRTYISISFNRKDFVFALYESPSIKKGSIGFNGMQRRWVGVTLQNDIDVNLFEIDINTCIISKLTLEVDFYQKKKTTPAAYHTDKMAEQVRSSFMLFPQTVNQEYFLKFEDKPYLAVKVKEMEIINSKSVLAGYKAVSTKANMGVIKATTLISFERKEDSTISLTGKSVGKSAMPNIINPDWDFSQLGIGGLDGEFSAIFRRAFASRVFPPELIEQLGMSHVKGILLHGPPGTGKTLMARQVGKMLNTREPKIVNGPEILNKYVGESEKNIRELFSSAEEDQKKFGANSPLHLIIFDEIDAICKQRGTVTGSTGVADTVVNQLLSKIDGVEQLNNILIIGMTNRRDLIDEALLRPGRLEVQMEIGLPDEHGRVQILEIHTAKLKESGKLADEVDLEELAGETKNFSGAELEGLVRAATTTAMNKLIKVDGKVSIAPDAIENLRVTRMDFYHAIQHDVKPKFGTGSDDTEHFLGNGIIRYGQVIDNILSTARLLIEQTKNSRTLVPVSVLFQGIEGSGKTSLAAHIAYKLSGFPCVIVCSPEKMIGYSEGSKCQAIKQVFDDAAKSELSCIIIDNIEGLLGYVPIGPRFSSVVLETLTVLIKRNLKKGRRLLIIGTSSLDGFVLGNKSLKLLSCFSTTVDVPPICDVESMVNILRDLRYFDENQIQEIQKSASRKICISVKRLTSLVEMANEAEENCVVSEFVGLLTRYYQNI